MSIDRTLPERLAAAHRLQDVLDGAYGTPGVGPVLHAEPFVARAAQELRASGETARKRDPSTLISFTPMERQVAELVRRGLSNKEIAPSAGSRRAPWPSTFGTASRRPASPPAANSPGSSSPRP